MKPLEWRESKRPRIGRMLVADRGPWARAFVWLSKDKDEWVWEIDIGGPHGSSVIDYAPTEEEAKKAAERYFWGIIQMLCGDGAK
jgi:hypothetical protein